MDVFGTCAAAVCMTIMMHDAGGQQIEYFYGFDDYNKCMQAVLVLTLSNPYRTEDPIELIRCDPK
jgi:hypothetical protein